MSAPRQLDKTDWGKIVNGALVAVAGSLLAYASSAIVPTLPLEYQAVAAPVLAILLNMIRKWLKDTGEQQ